MDFSGFFKDNSWLGDVIGGIGDLYGSYNRDSARSRAMDAARNAEQYNYDNYLAEDQYYRQYATDDYNARVAAAAASAAAAATNAANKMKAQKRGFGAFKKQNKKQQALWQPYAQSGARILPQMEQLYGNAARGMNLLSGYMNTPEFYQQMNQQTPASQVEIPLPDYLRNRK